MNQYFTKTFFKFLLGFLAIIGVSFGVIVGTAQWRTIHPLDNVAVPD